MLREHILLEFEARPARAFERYSAMIESPADGFREAEGLVANLAGFGLDLDDESIPVPLFTTEGGTAADGIEPIAFSSVEEAGDLEADRMVVACSVDRAKRGELEGREGVRVWPNSELTLFSNPSASGAAPSEDRTHMADAAYGALIDGARSVGGVDCRPFRPGATIEEIRALLSVDFLWRQGFRGQNVIVGIIDEGVDGSTYPVIGGFSRPNAGRQPGSAPVTSHGSMCAADILIAAPAARIFDYPFLGVPRSGGALQMFQAVLDQRRRNGTPHITNNSYGFVGVPDPTQFPKHEVHDPQHPLHRKIREVIQAGVPCFFAAGNCGQDCPSASCHRSGIGAGRSIHASNSLDDVITVAAVNSRHERIGYSSQGPGMFYPQKPDIASYSHIFANFGPGRPGGLAQPFDNGTSAATPVAAGVAALLLSGAPNLQPAALKAALIDSAAQVGPAVGWNPDYGNGVVNAAAAFHAVRSTGH